MKYESVTEDKRRSIRCTSRLLRLHMMCNTTSVNIDYDNFTGTEIELIKNLEEATNEIEALLKENDKLTKLSNALRSELNNAKHTPSSDIISQPPLPPTRSDNEHRAYEQTLLDAILNDQSRSCESEGSHDDEVVACIGRKPPLAIAANSRPSKTAYVRTVLQFIAVSLCYFPH